MAREFKLKSLEHGVASKSELLGHTGPLMHKIQASFCATDRDGNILHVQSTHVRPAFSQEGVYEGN